jgi:hypothetical protein
MTCATFGLRLVIHRPPHPCRCDVPRQLSHSNCAVISVLPFTNPYLTMTLQQIASAYMEDYTLPMCTYDAGLKSCVQ